ncbi:ArnT family glycosyltransferase [Nocardioides panacisoli]|uniref:Glycosyltransferase family 39 protein n=1 Tax=Nocardioides panacisoli TaxID=627624 RepID=A0ABP7IHY3_9ACTN
MTALDDVLARTTPPPGPAAPEPDRPSARTRRASLAALLAVTAVAYLWTLSESGYANSFYAAAAQAGSESWKAFFFGSLDIGSSITVDKPPAALWAMGLSVRVFGLSSWSILVPEALMGVATVALVHATVRRTAGHWAGIVAGAATATTPVAALMFRFDNPDALLVLLLVAAGYATMRATEAARGRWLVLAGVLVGFAFLTKMLQAFLVLPAFVLVYLLAAPTTVRRRLLHLIAAFGAMLASAGWWVAIVELVPESWRPYVDGSQDNSVLELIWGYNGLGRLTGDEAGGHGNAGFGSAAGILRLFQGVSGGMVTWLLPAALALLVAGVVMRGRAPRTDRTRALLLLTGGSMVVTGLVFSFMAGIYHDYYTVALAPWIAATAVVGGAEVWRHRRALAARLVLGTTVAFSAGWAAYLLGQSGQQPYLALRWVVLVLGVLSASAIVAADRLSRRLAAAALLGAVLSLGIGPAAYSVQTVTTAHTGSIVTAGPYQGSMSGPGGHGWPGAGGGPGGGAFPGGPPPGGMTGAPPTQGTPGAMPGGAAGGLLDGAQVSDQLVALLSDDADSYTWVAATGGAQGAASYQLATGDPVMPIGGFNGTSPSPTLAQFQEYVDQGEIHYYVAGGGMGAMGGQSGSTSTASQIEDWVSANFSSTTVDGVTVYDLTSPVSSSGGSTVSS